MRAQFVPLVDRLSDLVDVLLDRELETGSCALYLSVDPVAGTVERCDPVLHPYQWDEWAGSEHRAASFGYPIDSCGGVWPLHDILYRASFNDETYSWIGGGDTLRMFFPDVDD